MKVRAAIVGISGYTGIELYQILSNSEHCSNIVVYGYTSAGKFLSEIYPFIYKDTHISPISEFSQDGIDVVFLCLPHSKSQLFLKNLDTTSIKVIDLGSDFRIKNLDLYHQYYEQHQYIDLISKFEYGLTELNLHNIKKAQYIACPGCYATSILIPIIPLLSNAMINPKHIIADSKSGISGAGRTAIQKNMFCERNENIYPYSISTHRHIAEMLDFTYQATGIETQIQFTPHVVPINRGIISTIYVEMQNHVYINDVHNFLHKHYAQFDHIKIAPLGMCISTQDIINTSFCKISVHPSNIPNHVVMISALDNLLKGASGQAYQNMKIMFE